MDVRVWQMDIGVQHMDTRVWQIKGDSWFKSLEQEKQPKEGDLICLSFERFRQLIWPNFEFNWASNLI